MRNKLRLCESEFKAIAEEYQTDVIALKALCKVESGKRGGFLVNERPKILFEGHVFWRELKRRFIKPEKLTKIYPDIVYPTFDRSKYRGGPAEYIRLSKAISIHEEAALRSTSWGMFQVMGFNHKLCGESKIMDFVKKMYANEASQLRLSLNFIRNAGILDLLNEHRWSDFARLYNGPEYKANNYDERLRDAYEKILQKKESPTPQ